MGLKYFILFQLTFLSVWFEAQIWSGYCLIVGSKKAEHIPSLSCLFDVDDSSLLW